jgi:predicted acetyltransferase
VDGSLKMNKVIFIINSELDNSKRNEIIALKQQHWPYDIESQRAWMHNNLNDYDVHVCLEKDEKLLAYLNLVKINVRFGIKKTEMLGVGNVCTHKLYLHQGLATELVLKVNEYLISEGIKGILLCHKQLLNFYIKCGWNNISNNLLGIYIGKHKYKSCILCYNYTPPQNIIAIIDRNF